MNLKTRILFVAILMVEAAICQEEFLGPFPSWANARTAYGAVGDGIADDTSALQAGLNSLGNDGQAVVLYLPAGTYRITRTLTMAAKTNVALIGEDPARSIIRYDGPAGQDMLYANGVRYTRWSRLTWDGAGKAKTAVNHGWDGKTGLAATGLEHSDSIFQDVQFGIRAGTYKPGEYQDAEASVVRVRFLRCSQACISIESWNALDWWIRDSEFVSSRLGVTNEYGAGSFHVYTSVFRDSSYSDISIHDAFVFSIRGNTSVNSKKFFTGVDVGQNSANVTIQGNRIITPRDDAAISVRNLGPLMLIDNQFQSRAGAQGPVVEHRSGYAGLETVSIGNTFTVNNPVVVESPSSRFRTMGDKIVSSLSLSVPALPAAPPRVQRQIFEVPATAGDQYIQETIAKAAAYKGQRPVIHLQPGTFWIYRTIWVPVGLDVQIVGDSRASRMQWMGPDQGPMLCLLGPSRALLADFAMHGASRASGIVIENADQENARVFAHQAYTQSSGSYNLRVDGIERARVRFEDYLHLIPGLTSVKVTGGPDMADGAGPGVTVLAGALGTASNGAPTIYDVSNRGSLIVQDSFYEGWAPGFARLGRPGSLTLQGALIAPYPQAQSGPSLTFDGFPGSASIVNSMIQRNVQVANESASTRILLLGIAGRDSNFFSRTAGDGKVALFNSSQSVSNTGWYAVPETGAWDPDFVGNMLAQARAVSPSFPLDPLPEGVTDVQMYRLQVSHGPVNIHIKKLGLVNTGDYSPGPVAQGSLFSIFGERLSNDQGSASAFPLPRSIGATRVELDGAAIPLLYVSPGQINAQIPFEARPGLATLTIKAGDVTLYEVSVPITSVKPGFFVDGEGSVLAVDPDKGLIGPSNPARPDSVLVAYLTGGGAAAGKTPPTGEAAPLQSLPIAASSELLVGGVPARIEYLGFAPSWVGLYQLNFRVPALPDGAHQIDLKVGDWHAKEASLQVAAGR
jgi:uncharacterized protein (TIGR03437 family)